MSIQPKSSLYSNKGVLDKFYTKPSVAINCIDFLTLPEYDCVIEPSAGSGSFFNNINHNNKIGLDLSPENNLLIMQQDWFEYSIDPSYEKVLVVGNPPFGKNNKLSISFIKHATSFDNVKCIAFVLPDVFNKHTLQKHIPSRFRLKAIHCLPQNSFLIENEEYHVPCSFFIFEDSEGECLRFNPSLYTETDHFTYGTKDDHDFFVFGAAPSKTVDTPLQNNRGYYIKVKDGLDVEEIKSNFKNIDWKGNSSANGGVFWLTKPELIKNYQEGVVRKSSKNPLSVV